MKKIMIFVASMLVNFHCMASLPGAFSVSAAEFTNPQQLLHVTLPNGHKVDFTTTTVDLGFNSTGIKGISTSGERLVGFVGPSRLEATIYTLGGNYLLYRDQESGNYVWSNNPALTKVYSPTFNDLENSTRPVQLKRNKPADNASYKSRPMEKSAESNPISIDVLGLYSSAFRDAYDGDEGAKAEVARQIFLANTMNESSGVNVSYRLLDVELYTGATEATDVFRNLRTLVTDPAIADYRDLIGADVVAMFRNAGRIACDGVTGLATGFNLGVQEEPPLHFQLEYDGMVVSSTGPHSGSGTRCADFLFPHEIGHLLSAGHAYTQHNIENLYWKTYAHGWDCGHENSSGQTTMGGNDEANKRSDSFLGIYSNPDLGMAGTPCGTTAESGDEGQQANNAKAMRLAAPYVADYMPIRVGNE